MNSGGDSDRQQDEKARKSLRSGEEMRIERLVSPEEILPAGETAYLKQLKATHRARAHAAMHWRPRFLKALRMSCNWTDSLKAAHVSYNTVKLHERNDPEFAAELKEAEQEGIEMLHAVCWKSAIEGNVEPVYWQGQIVGEVLRYDNRLRIEMLRAHMPHLFKTPGAKVSINSGNSPNVGIVMDAAETEKLIAARREALEAMKLPAPPSSAPPNGGAESDSGNSPGVVQ